jgi:hypothetical protein
MSAPTDHIFNMLMDLYKMGFDHDFEEGLRVADKAAQSAIQEYFGVKAPEGGAPDVTPSEITDSGRPKDWFFRIAKREDRKANYTKFKKRLSLMKGGISE